MAIYRYQSDSPISYARLLVNETGGRRAYLHATDDASSEQLRATKQHFRSLGWQCIPLVHEGEPALEVRGYTTDDELLAELTKKNMVSGPANITTEPGDERTRASKLRSHTLQAAGISYNLGDISYLYYKLTPLVKDWNKFELHERKAQRFFGSLDVAAGLGYGLGSIALTKFGGRDQSVNVITRATTQIERHARGQGLEISPETSIAYANDKIDRGWWGNVKHFVAKYPSETLNSIYVFVGLFMSAAAIYHGTRKIPAGLTGKDLKFAKTDRLWDRVDIGLGAITATSAITGIAVKEHKPVEGEKKREGFIGHAVDWVREKPLRATGVGYMAATACHAVSTYGKWKDGRETNKKYLIGRVIFIMTNVLSEVLLTISSKGHGAGVKPDASVDNSVIATAAELIFRQPAEKREALIEQMAGYMGSSDVLATSAGEIATELRTHLAMLEKNPWTKHYVPQNDLQLQYKENEVTASVSNLSKMIEQPRSIVSKAYSQGMLQNAALAVAK